jgi:ureidoglycolate lyase
MTPTCRFPYAQPTRSRLIDKPGLQCYNRSNRWPLERRPAPITDVKSIMQVRKESPMPENRVVAVRPLSAEAFAPYGEVFTGQPTPPDGAGSALRRLEKSDFTGGRAVMQMLTMRWRDLSFTHLEQHASFTQAFLPADGKPAIFVVALPVAGPGSAPDLSTLRAFLLDGTQGILLFKGTWHCPVFALTEQTTYAMTTCIDTPADTEGYLDVTGGAGPFRIVL